MRRILLKSFQSPGDIIMLTAAVRDLHLTHPEQFDTRVLTSCLALWKHNPYVTFGMADEPDAEVISCAYPLIDQSNELPYHFVHGYRLFLEERLGVDIRPHAFRGDLYLSDAEKSAPSPAAPLLADPSKPYWIIVAGGKKDFTAKWWAPERYQAVVDHFRGELQFVQCGARGDFHVHPPLEGVADMVGKTDLRDVMRLIYHAEGVICPVTVFMHMAAAVEPKPGAPLNRPCVVVAGGREPSQWEAYPHHQYLHRNGCLPCCDNGGCWKSRTVALNDGSACDDSLCLLPTATPAGGVLPKCMDMITPDEVIRAVESYRQYQPVFAALRPAEPAHP